MHKLGLFSGVGLIAAAAAIFAVLQSEKAAGPSPPEPENGAVSPQNLDISLQELDVRSPRLRALKLSALGGSVEAADRLMAWASKCPKVNLRTKADWDRCRVVSGYWGDIALQNGSTAAAQWETNGLLYSDKCADVHRAEYWYGKHKNAYAHDQVLLESERAEIEEKKRSCTW